MVCMIIKFVNVSHPSTNPDWPEVSMLNETNGYYWAEPPPYAGVSRMYILMLFSSAAD